MPLQKNQILTVSEGHLRFAEADEPLDRKIVIVETRITNTVIDPIHLQFDFVAYRDLTRQDSCTELSIIARGCGITEHLGAQLRFFRFLDALAPADTALSR